MRPFFVLLLCSLLFYSCNDKTETASAPSTPVNDIIDLDLASDVYDFHEQVKNPNIIDRRFKHQDVVAAINQLDPSVFEVKKAGESIEGRDIFLVKMGQGPVNVLLWSQMHGDEATATMAITDLFNFFQQKEQFQEFIAMLQNELSIYFIPMLNPDGAERFQRRNALGVDLNRDALRLQSPEAQLLKRIRDSLDADWGFNLHDQNRYYATGQNPATASVSFLAPAYNYEKEVNDNRADAMKLIVGMNEVLQQYMPDKVGRYSDAFEPRAFGDNIQKWGTRTILIESGTLNEDREKQNLRHLNFTILLSAFNEIAKGAYEQLPIAIYDSIPYNNSNTFHDLMIRKVNVMVEGEKYMVDLAFRYNEIEYNDDTDYYLRGYIADMGDLHIQYGYEELDAGGLTAVPGKIYSSNVNNRRLRRLDPLELLRNGTTELIMKNPPPSRQTWQLPLRISSSTSDDAIEVGENPSLVLQNENGEVKYVIVNGLLWDLAEEEMIKESWGEVGR